MASGPRIPFSGILLVVFGALFLADQLGAVKFGDVFSKYWPSLLVLAGVLNLLERPASLFGPIALIIAGSVLLLAKFGYLEIDSLWRLWPVVLIAVGMNILFSNSRGKKA